MKSQMRRLNKQPTLEKGLIEVVKRLWDEVELEVVDKAIDSMRDRRLAVIASKGMQTNTKTRDVLRFRSTLQANVLHHSY